MRLARDCRELDGVGDGLVDELGGLEQAVGKAELVRPAAVEHPVLAERVLDDEVDRGLGSDEPWDELRSSPAGNDPEQALGAGEVANRSRDRARIAMKGELDTAAETGAVDRGHGWIRQGPDAGKELVAGPAAVARKFRRDA